MDTGWRLELFYSDDYFTVGAGADGSAFTDNRDRSTWELLYLGIAHPWRILYNEDHSDPFEVVEVLLDHSPNLAALFTDPEYAPMVHTDADGNERLQFGFDADNGIDQGVGAAAQTLYNDQRTRQIFWNLRKVPTVEFRGTNYPRGNSHGDYLVNIPNVIGYPEHKRCLVQVQSLSVFPHNEFKLTDFFRGTKRGEKTGTRQNVGPVYVGVQLEGVGCQNIFTTAGGTVRNSQLVGTCCLDAKGAINYDFTDPSTTDSRNRGLLSFGFDNSRSILDDGVLINSPFGKDIRVRFLNLTTNETLNTSRDETADDFDDVVNNPTHLTLRLLFLDDDDLPMR